MCQRLAIGLIQDLCTTIGDKFTPYLERVLHLLTAVLPPAKARSDGGPVRLHRALGHQHHGGDGMTGAPVLAKLRFADGMAVELPFDATKVVAAGTPD